MFVRFSHFVDLIRITNDFRVPLATVWPRQFSAWKVFLRDSDEWSKATFITNYLPIMLFPVLYVSAK